MTPAPQPKRAAAIVLYDFSRGRKYRIPAEKLEAFATEETADVEGQCLTPQPGQTCPLCGQIIAESGSSGWGMLIT